MMGVDPDWVYTDASRRFATYTRLAPGKYTFRIKASNNDGVWNENGLSVRIVITPPWWRTVWAYALYLLLFVSVIYASYRFLLNRARTRQLLRFEHLEAEKLRDLDRMKSQFFANISHEFRTPLTLILGPVEKLLAKTGDAKVRQDLSMVLRNARRLQRLISQLLDLSRLEAGKMSLHTREEDVVALVKQYVQHFESQATIKGINLRFSAAAGPIRAYIDREKIENIVYNLVSNAFKFTPGDGEINVSVAELPLSRADSAEGVKFDCRHGYVKIAVRDTGCGIRADRIGRIFDRFFKADDSTTREHEGTGIGLALTRELVELHKGKISVRSVEGRGSTFIVLLPLGKDHLKAGEIAAEPADHLEGTGLGESAMVERVRKKSITRLNGAEGEYTVSAGGGQKPGARSTRKSAIILIIEDNADLRAYIRDILYSENRILEAADGAQGLDAAVESIPDLIISDVVMPRMDGFELCRRLKTDERSSHIPVILLTARASGESKLTGLETGADDYIIKPFDSRELSARVKNLIEQRRKLRERFSQAVTLKPSEIAVTSADEKFLRRAIDIIENHLSDADFRVDQFGREIGLSRVQLHRKLRALTGKSATGFIRAIRLQRAVVLLEHRYGNISEIAYEVGFSKPSYFAECFRKQFGCLPSEYTGRDN
jgi:signal transduction histidine kinase/DNA-binding response OmpR family regulator